MLFRSVLLEMNRRRVGSAREFRAMVAQFRPGESIALLVYDRISDQRVLRALSIDPQ